MLNVVEPSGVSGYPIQVKPVDSMPTVTDRSRNYAGAVGVAVTLAAMGIYLEPKSLLLPLELMHELADGFAAQVFTSAPEGIRLLPGYTHTPMRGIDSVLGRIVKLGGPVISYELGGFRADIMDSVGAVLWTKSHKVHADAWIEGRKIRSDNLRMVMHNDGRLSVDPGLGSFNAKYRPH